MRCAPASTNGPGRIRRIITGRKSVSKKRVNSSNASRRCANPMLSPMRSENFLNCYFQNNIDVNTSLDQLKELLRRARAEVGKVIIGQNEAIDLCLITIFTRSHALIEGVPGVAKTLLVRTLAQALATDFSRI